MSNETNPQHGANRDDPAAAFSRAMDARPSSTRERDLRRYGKPKRHTQLIWVAIAVVGLALFVLLMRGVMEKTKWTAGPSDRAAVARDVVDRSRMRT